MRLVHRVQAPGQRFRVRAAWAKSRFSGLFIGTYSPFALAALCKGVPRTRPVRCGFSVESPVVVSLHRAALCMPCAVALLKDSRHETVGSRQPV